MSYTTGKFTVDEVGFIQTALTKVLAAVAAGELDLNRLALEELACRGMDRQGRCVGVATAKSLLSLNNENLRGQSKMSTQKW